MSTVLSAIIVATPLLSPWSVTWRDGGLAFVRGGGLAFVGRGIGSINDL